MSDAANSSLSDANFRMNIPDEISCGSDTKNCPNRHDRSGAEILPGALAPENSPELNPISSAAGETARRVGGHYSTHATPVEGRPEKDRRRRRRALISAPVCVRGINVTQNEAKEIATTIDVSRGGILFTTRASTFYRGMQLAVTFPFCDAPGAIQAEQLGRVVRVHDLPGGRRAVAVSIGAGVTEDLADSSGPELDKRGVRACNSQAADKPMVLAVDADDMAREILKNYLSNEGYSVITVKNGSEARKVLEMFTPALLIAEVEGVDLPGYALCAYAKSKPELKKIPVLLTTRSGNPTDYSNAHSLGAVVCMAKPYKQERLGHVVRLLAPPPASLLAGAHPPRTPDSTRRFRSANPPKPVTTVNGSRRFRFPSLR